jgi:hypothetical protein
MAQIGKRKYINQRVRQSGGKVDAKYLAACHGKIRHTRESAMEAASVTKVVKLRMIVLNAYKCSYCDHWHVGRRAK